MVVRLIFAFCLLAASTRSACGFESLDAELLAKRLDAVLEDHPTAQRTTVTLKVVDLESGETLYDRGGNRLQVPASNLKIYTSACALDAFGPDHRFQTIVRADGPIDNGVLRGNLKLIGGGDAMLTSKDLRELAKRVVRELGIRQIVGEVVVDNSRYAPRLKGPGWMWDDEPSYYNMSVTPLMVDFNVLTVKLTPDAEGFVYAKLDPPSSSPELVSVGADGATGNALATRRPFTEPIEYRGDRKLDKPTDLKLTMHDPGPWVAGMFSQMLADEGVNFSPSPRKPSANPSDKTPAREIVHEGPTLAETLKHFNHVSENAVGEVLIHEISLARGVERPDWPAGAKAISAWLIETAKLEPGSFRYVDGSGLSRYNLISADSAVRLLQYLKQSDDFEPFFQSLPTSEVTLDAPALAGARDQSKTPRVSAKGGSMSSVSTMSGYLRTLDGRLLAFSLLANGFIGNNEPVFDLRQQVWRELVRYQP
ncbi:MAG: D-alanyl-D-alanine carboxypeptidase/D-alanyl-D-alanine-endopeptidase [Planctomycetaceae bacterium]|nr:D-alanyl-D-alanine carboxypeptidase/D-alanyl-D-alanine-endopeptidase [Planctomycetaceae bacterium]